VTNATNVLPDLMDFLIATIVNVILRDPLMSLVMKTGNAHVNPALLAKNVISALKDTLISLIALNVMLNTMVPQIAKLANVILKAL